MQPTDRTAKSETDAHDWLIHICRHYSQFNAIVTLLKPPNLDIDILFPKSVRQSNLLLETILLHAI